MMVGLPFCTNPSDLGNKGAFWPTAGASAVFSGGGDIHDDNSRCQVIAKFNVCGSKARL